ncbi:hypothetical protein V6N13_123922 [Hibiscus sabdariffa]|uniref:Uncharacterized protein n=1 Tax=Hibiscus sabdariffa TaxID=183260 RepID=A0ABR2QUW7_9ROSI
MDSKTHTGPEKLNEAETTENEDRSPVEEVALVVPETNDPSLPVMTLRAWFLGLTSCVVLIFLNTFFTYRTQPLTISCNQIQRTEVGDENDKRRL